jgi:hypothetical protein
MNLVDKLRQLLILTPQNPDDSMTAILLHYPAADDGMTGQKFVPRSASI